LDSLANDVLLLARYGDQGEPHKVLPNVSQEMHRRRKEDIRCSSCHKTHWAWHAYDSRDLVLDPTCESGAAAYVAEWRGLLGLVCCWTWWIGIRSRWPAKEATIAPFTTERSDEQEGQNKFLDNTAAPW